MSLLVRKFYTNTGLRGTQIDQLKPKLSVAFTAVRNEQNEQVVQFGISACHPNDQFKRKVGGAIAESRLKLVTDGSEIPADVASYVGSVIFPPETDLDEIPGLIVGVHEHLHFLVRKAQWKEQNEAVKKYQAALEKRFAMLKAVYESPEYLENEKELNRQAELAYRDGHDVGSENW